ncbi:MAG: ABC transporter ATP-binding protein [Candidatus Heimdallarchaeota archaeon]|nr:MAG: ABC transporter ATP-binding protein [Candidatus Heimdallarchaeota archaeon]
MSEDITVKLDDVWKTYIMGNEEVQALRGINLDILQGEFHVIMGPSGSGKTTFLNMVGALDFPTMGEVYFEGVPLSSLTKKQLASIRSYKIGFIFQTFNLVPVITARENVSLPLVFQRYPREERRKRAEEILKRVGLADRMDHTPDELSGGQQQRVAIARALAGKPSLILADEPTGNLDLKTGFQIVELLRELSQETGVTVINSTHDLKLIDIADRISWLRDGEITRTQQKLDVSITSVDVTI